MIDKIKLAKVFSKSKGTRSGALGVVINKVQSFTDVEIDAINEEFGHWDDKSHFSWVTKKIAENNKNFKIFLVNIDFITYSDSISSQSPSYKISIVALGFVFAIFLCLSCKYKLLIEA